MTEFLDKLPIKVGKSKKNLDVLHWLVFRPLFDCLDLFIFYTNTFQRYQIAEDLKFFLIKSIFFYVDIQQKLHQLF